MLRVQTWMVIASAELRGRVLNTVEKKREKGALTLEYVVIAAALFVAVAALVGVIVTKIGNEQTKIEQTTP